MTPTQASHEESTGRAEFRRGLGLAVVAGVGVAVIWLFVPDIGQMIASHLSGWLIIPHPRSGG